MMRNDPRSAAAAMARHPPASSVWGWVTTIVAAPASSAAAPAVRRAGSTVSRRMPEASAARRGLGVCGESARASQSWLAKVSIALAPAERVGVMSATRRVETDSMGRMKVLSARSASASVSTERVASCVATWASSVTNAVAVRWPGVQATTAVCAGGWVPFEASHARTCVTPWASEPERVSSMRTGIEPVSGPAAPASPVMRSGRRGWARAIVTLSATVCAGDWAMTRTGRLVVERDSRARARSIAPERKGERTTTTASDPAASLSSWMAWRVRRSAPSMSARLAAGSVRSTSCATWAASGAAGRTSARAGPAMVMRAARSPRPGDSVESSVRALSLRAVNSSEEAVPGEVDVWLVRLLSSNM